MTSFIFGMFAGAAIGVVLMALMTMARGDE